jgi:hypothetical protein
MRNSRRKLQRVEPSSLRWKKDLDIAGLTRREG